MIYLFYLVNIMGADADGPGDVRSQGISNHDCDIVKPR